MSDPTSAAESNASSTPQTELQALVSLVTDLSQTSLTMATQCLDVWPSINASTSIFATSTMYHYQLAPLPSWRHLIPRTPEELDDTHAGDNESKTWHVVTVGREPGLYNTNLDIQVLGVPGASRQHIPGLAAALAHYCAKYIALEVEKWAPATEVTPV
ncbi:hypothetical protein K438DRAFT_1992426 [Mycena galopus ATCC 62051]|nr:hypothetical protein K438DRAFT_1992426 [Mycena galopus ATCC 62051]